MFLNKLKLFVSIISILLVICLLELGVKIKYCYALPGETIEVTSKSVRLGNTADFGVRTEIGRFTNNYGENIWVSMVNHNYIFYEFLTNYSITTSGGVNGTLRYEIRKNGINGEVILDTTVNYNNQYLLNGVLQSLYQPGLLSGVTLKYGETLHWVITHNLTYNGSNLRLTPVSASNGRWSITYWKSDALVQQSVDNAYNAYLSANVAATNALNAMNAANAAKTSADNANTNAWTAQQNSWYSGTYGGASESVANIAGYIRNTQLPNLETKINNLQTSVTNIQNADNLPPSVEIDTVSGAKATSSSSIQLIVAASDNKSSTFTYSVNGGGYSSLPADGKITVSLPAVGPNTVTVRVKDDAGNVTTKTIKIWRLS